MTHEELPVQMLGRVMRVGQLLATVESNELEANSGENTSRKFEDEFVEGNEDPKQKQLKH